MHVLLVFLGKCCWSLWCFAVDSEIVFDENECMGDMFQAGSALEIQINASFASNGLMSLIAKLVYG